MSTLAKVLKVKKEDTTLYNIHIMHLNYKPHSMSYTADCQDNNGNNDKTDTSRYSNDNTP